jgi:sugar phosphate isomerase/epimerase
MQLGFVSAILPELSLDDVARFAAATGYKCVELMCWPAGKAERRYAGVTHVDVNDYDRDTVLGTVQKHGITISGLGYYPNPLAPDQAEADTYVAHIRKVIAAAAKLGVNVMNTFIGRDPRLSVDENWPRFMRVWPDIIRFAEDQGVRVGIENCPMSFSRDEWPGGKNLANSPAVWRRMFDAIPSGNFGLNYDPSHLVWQHMDYVRPIREFTSKLFHVHAKDARVEKHKLDEVGIFAYPLEYHTPKLPGLGDVDWGRFFSVLSDSGYDGPVCVEVEDRAYEGSVDRRKASLIQSQRYLSQFVE